MSFFIHICCSDFEIPSNKTWTTAITLPFLEMNQKLGDNINMDCEQHRYQKRCTDSAAKNDLSILDWTLFCGKIGKKNPKYQNSFLLLFYENFKSNFLIFLYLMGQN